MRWDEFREFAGGLLVMSLCLLTVVLWMVTCAPS